MGPAFQVVGVSQSLQVGVSRSPQVGALVVPFAECWAVDAGQGVGRVAGVSLCVCVGGGV